MDETIRVHLAQPTATANYVMRFVDPITRRTKQRSTRTTDLKDAKKAAAVWEAELRQGRGIAPSRVTWEAFRKRYEAEHLPSLAPRTAPKARRSLDWVEMSIRINRLAELTAARLSAVQTAMRKAKLSEPSIKGYLAHLKAALNWAKRQGLLREVPPIDMPRRAKQSKMAKGRALTLEEFERMLDKLPDALAESKNKQRKEPKRPTAEALASWRYFLRGLLRSGLRLEKSLELTWDDYSRLHVDLTERRPTLRIPAALEKGNEDRLLPITPDFTALLEETPVDQRTGYVFLVAPIRPERSGRLGSTAAGRIIAKAGELAHVIVKQDSRTGKKKFASAHDLRRTFATRLAKAGIPPHLLAKMMRHSSYTTTERYYVTAGAMDMADALWKLPAGNLGDTLHDTTLKNANGAESASAPSHFPD